MSLIADHETCSYWDHITGKCVHGPLKERQLDLAPLRHMQASQALAHFPEARIAIARMKLKPSMIRALLELWQWMLGERFILPVLTPSMGEEDPRRPRMEMGLGVWTETGSRFYPLDILKADGVLIDHFDDKTMLIYLDPISGTPTPLFADVEQAEWSGDILRLDHGATVRNGRLYDPYGAELPSERPLHLFTRWYGFSFTFPNCEIGGD